MTNPDQFPIGPSAGEAAQLTGGQRAMAGMIVHQEAQLASGGAPNEYDAIYAPADASDLAETIHGMVHGTNEDFQRPAEHAATSGPKRVMPHSDTSLMNTRAAMDLAVAQGQDASQYARVPTGSQYFNTPQTGSQYFNSPK